MTIDPNGKGGPPPGVEHHLKTCRRLIRQADYELEKRGDRVQACDKAAGAVAHGVKAAAAARYWRSGSHNYRRRIVHLLSVEYDRPDLRVMQDIADKMHDNFYEDLLYDEEVRDRLERVTGLLATFMELLAREPNPDFAPTPDQERMLSRLRLTAEEIAERWLSRLRLTAEEIAERWLVDYPPPPPEDAELPEAAD